jgi:16S rRNA pseudouridine516 synthase
MTRLVKYLAHLGYGSRREVTHLFTTRRVTDSKGTVLGPEADVAHDAIHVDGEPLDPPPGSVILLHKPVGFVCSTTDASHPVIYELLPTRFRSRDPIMAPVGRLDVDTSGLLLVTDDGPLNHRLTTPRAHLPKVYVVTLADPLRGDEAERFASGTMRLESDPAPLAPAQLQTVGERQARVTLDEGRYHQVRRMFAAVGNHVVALERIAIGRLTLGDLPPGQWRVLTPDERALLSPPKAP